MLTQEELAERINSLLKQNKITQKQLSELSGKKQSYISKYMTGNVKIPVEILLIISDLLGMSINQLITSEENFKPGEKIESANPEEMDLEEIAKEVMEIKKDISLLKKVLIEKL